MWFVRSWADPERWQWISTADPERAPEAEFLAQPNNSATALLFEAGLVLLLPLALAVLVEAILGT